MLSASQLTLPAMASTLCPRWARLAQAASVCVLGGSWSAVQCAGNADETATPLHLVGLEQQLADLKRDAQRTQYGPPYGYPTLTDVRHCDTFTLGLDGAHKTPAWVYERLSKHFVKQENNNSQEDRPSPNRGRSCFHVDGSMPPRLQVQHHAYAGSGLDRGHMAPAADHKHSQHAMDATFRMSNITPQVGRGLNRDYWARLEQLARMLRARGHTVHVFSGPAFLPRHPAHAPNNIVQELTAVRKSLSPHGLKHPESRWWSMHPWVGSPTVGLVGVPTHFFKVILVEQRGEEANANHGDILAVLLPNAPIDAATPLTDFLVPLSSLQRAVGFPFFPLLLEEHVVEAADAALLAPFAPPAHVLMQPGSEDKAERPNPDSPLITLPGKAHYTLGHLCSTEEGCSLPPADWWRKNRKALSSNGNSKQ